MWCMCGWGGQRHAGTGGGGRGHSLPHPSAPLGAGAGGAGNSCRETERHTERQKAARVEPVPGQLNRAQPTVLTKRLPAGLGGAGPGGTHSVIYAVDAC